MAINLDKPAFSSSDSNAARNYRFVGLSTEAKPTTSTTNVWLEDGCEFYEQDTNRLFYFSGGQWHSRPLATLYDACAVLAEIKDIHLELLQETKALRALIGLSLTEMIGDNFDLGTPEIAQLQEN